MIVNCKKKRQVLKIRLGNRRCDIVLGQNAFMLLHTVSRRLLHKASITFVWPSYDRPNQQGSDIAPRGFRPVEPGLLIHLVD
jgi:hypothetical protein